MSQQMTDPFIWNDEKWIFLGADDVYSLFDPQKYGLVPSPLTTACWKGFVIQFSVRHNELFLDRLDVHCENNVYPEIAGILPIVTDNTRFHRYENIQQKLDYSGTITIGQKYLERYLGRSFTGPHMYEKVHELVFKNGVLQSYSDTSGKYTGF